MSLLPRRAIPAFVPPKDATLRDYFAAVALGPLLNSADRQSQNYASIATCAATAAYALADAMLKERDK